MSWARLLQRHVVAEPASRQELGDLRSIVARSLRDAAAKGLSADARFVMAYDAARSMSLSLVRAAGYRPRSVGGHYHTFVALKEVDSTFREIADYFDSCRMKRNQCEYDFAGGISDTDADQLLKSVRSFVRDADAWMKRHHPKLA